MSVTRLMVDEDRIKKELNSIASDRSLMGTISLHPDENQIHHLTATITGPVSTPYEGGVFHIDINLPEMYPFAPPHVKFVTKIWHPNIGSKNGAVNLNTLKDDWTPAMNLKAALISLQALLSEPELNEPQDAAVAFQYLHDNVKFIHKARRWTATHATNPPPPPPPPPPAQQSSRDSGRRARKLPRHLSDFCF